MRHLALAYCLTALLVSGPAAAQLLDDFSSQAGWSVAAATGARAELHEERRQGRSTLRIDYDFRGGGGEIIVHKPFPLKLPENFRLHLQLRGTSAQPLELRLVDESGGNVWRLQDLRLRIPPDWETLDAKRRRFEFGWGPAGGGAPARLGLIEIVIGRGKGGHGKLWLDTLELQPEAPARPYSGKPVLTASSALPGREPARLLDDPPAAGWHSASGSANQWLRIDFGELREFGGLVLDWDPEDYATAYRVEGSADGRSWRTLYQVQSGNGGRDLLPMPEAEARLLRLSFVGAANGRGFGIRRLEVAPLSFSASDQQIGERLARDAPRGAYPRSLLGEQSYWTVVGRPGSASAGAEGEALLSSDGQLEVAGGGFSVEPFVLTQGRLLGWAAARATPTLTDADLPIPSVLLDFGELELGVTALAPVSKDMPFLARYRLANHGETTAAASLFLLARPFLVNPAWQVFNSAGGVAPIRRLRLTDDRLWVEGRLHLLSLTPPAGAGVTGFDGYPITADLERDRVPAAHHIDDPRGWASAVLRYPLELPPGGAGEVILALPAPGDREIATADPTALWDQQLRLAKSHWRQELDRVELRVPPTARPLIEAVRSNLAYLLIHRDGPALRPGSRRYGRTWIRDAAVGSAVLLALGHAEEVREFLRWYAGFQTPDGAVPCCIDPWGPDSMVEHDSAGEFLYTAAAYYRYSGDRAFLQSLWPRLVRSVDHLESLRRQSLGPAFEQGEAVRFRGLLPASASHEGYMARPVHSYWDDYWAIRGLGDAAALAASLGDETQARRCSELRAALSTDLWRSLELTRRQFGLDVLPASAELGDFDPTSTAIAVTLGLPLSSELLPSIHRTFARYVAGVRQRRAGASDWEAYSPYEFRNVTALIRLGERTAAEMVLRDLFQGRRPPQWNQWPEIVWRDPGVGRFLGDLPHGWVGAEFIQAVLTAFAYEDREGRLVLGGGLPANWLETPDGVAVRGLRTPFGRLDYQIDQPEPGLTRLRLGSGLKPPPGGILIDLPPSLGIRAIGRDGRPLEIVDGRPLVRDVPAELSFRR